MATEQMTAKQLAHQRGQAGWLHDNFQLWRENAELFLAVMTLVALLIGWLGGMTGALPLWAITLAALVAFGAGGYSGLMGAIEEAKQGKLDIDFLMIAA